MKDNTPPSNSHYNKETDEYQSNYAHSLETAEIAQKNNTISYLHNVIYLAALLHDAGKYSDQWQKYFEEKIRHPDAPSGRKEDHTTAGGQLIGELSSNSKVSALLIMIETAIYSHHGLQNCISVDDSSVLRERRREKAKSLPIEECKERFFQDFNMQELQHLYMQAEGDIKKLCGNVQDKINSWNERKLYGNRDFFLGMFERMLISLLIDADRRNTEDFAVGRDIITTPTSEELKQIWTVCAEHIEKKINQFKDDQEKQGNMEINRSRREISDICLHMATCSIRRYRLAVPTGSGKTLSSLRFAISHALKYNKKRVIYVAPYQSIVDQNAEAIREAIGDPSLVLEHHSNIFIEKEEEQAIYDRITEDWDSPIIVTTAVQFLNTLFAGKPRNVRRMHSLCDSVIIMDEVQALPIKIIELFNLAINFLTEFTNATMVLCTATQPLLEDLHTNRLLPSKDMVQGFDVYEKLFRRTEIIDDTSEFPGGMTIDEAAHYISRKAELYNSVLFIANTKSCARNIFQKVKALCGDQYSVHHLSTSMCPKHRHEVLNEVRKNLAEKKPEICISTQMIEAGVDISFHCAIRSLAGLDSVIQAAGRCNRNKDESIGYVFIIKMNEEAENLSSLRDIRLAQQAMETVLSQFHKNPENLDNRLDSQKAISKYFELYFLKRKGEMNYPVTVQGVATNLVRLLSDNPDFTPKGRPLPILKQAFRTAGDEFEVIDGNGKLSVVVPFDEVAKKKLSDLDKPYVFLPKKKRILKELQLYTVEISETERRKIDNGIYGIWNGQVLELDERFYNKETGVTTEHKPLPEFIL